MDNSFISNRTIPSKESLGNLRAKVAKKMNQFKYLLTFSVSNHKISRKIAFFC
jgi:hypothetical protein